MLLKTLLFTFSSWICGLSNEIGSAVTIANERTSIKSVLKWLMPSSECASPRFSNEILNSSMPYYFILNCIYNFFM